jgi:hypothetical protein
MVPSPKPPKYDIANTLDHMARQEIGCPKNPKGWFLPLII